MNKKPRFQNYGRSLSAASSLRARNLLSIPGAIILFAGLAAACSAAGGAEAEMTRAAQTVALMVTGLARQQPSPTPTAFSAPSGAPTATVGPSITPSEIATIAFPTNTRAMRRATYNGSTPTTDPASLLTHTLTARCNAAFFVGYAAPIYENTEVAMDSTFTVTWVLRNAGTCTWYPSYFVYWHSGARMEAPAYFFLNEVVAPNQTLFLSVTLKAPDEPGKYYQRWYFRDPTDEQFGIGPDYDEPLMVRIVAV
ncbi:MAG: hypothetical protein JW929_11970 [Anaerolineales bacterium]|nr:hypothetical protein [Anaerolineales bacterium]